MMPKKSSRLNSVLILPMRNGNPEDGKPLWLDEQSSYPTYEEWKQALNKFQKKLEYGSYPTYEEWKQLMGYP